MKKRYIYSLLFGIPGCFVALVISWLLMTVIALFLYFFVIGDNSSPAWLNILTNSMLLVIFLAIWGAILFVGYTIGRRREEDL